MSLYFNMSYINVRLIDSNHFFLYHNNRMSQTYGTKNKIKTNLKMSGPYLHSKNNTDSARRIYLNQINLKRSIPVKSIEDQQHRKYHSSSRTNMRQLNLTLNKHNNHSQQRQLLSDRKTLQNRKNRNDTITGRHSKLGRSKFDNSLSKINKLTDKSTIISSIISNQNIREQKLKQDKKMHEQGKNCKVIVIEGTQETEHYIQVQKMGDVLEYLRKQYPKINYFKAVPVQITLDYLLTQKNIIGTFLNGQSLYLKAASRSSSTSDEQSVVISDFQVIKPIGSGGFSKVFLCRWKKNGQFYAMKVIDKQVIVKNKKKNIIMNQRNIMKQCNHPFLIQMKFAFQSQKSLVFIVQYCPGGELFSLIKKYKRLSQQIARFYIIQIFLGLAYLHQSNVVYRDIKPENILLAQDGHIKIADLGLAKPDMTEGQLAYSFCGSPQYMSPEMILQVGHTYPVDFYCMGALLYELLFGLPPFYSRDTQEIYEAVLSEQLQFPQDVPITNQCRSLLKGLLCKDPKQRLGSIHGVKQILAHPWFGKNSYKNFLQKKISPPVTYDSVGRIDLDKQLDDKQKKDVQDIMKQQKHESNRFKRQMKKFYYDYRGITQQNGQSSYINKQNRHNNLRSNSSRKLNSQMMASLERKSSQKQLSRTLNSSRR